MGIQINGQTDTVTSTTAGGSVTVTPANLPLVNSINATGISTLGVTSTTNLTAQQLNVSGVGTVATLNITQSNPTNLNVSGVTTTTTLRATSIVGVTTAGITTAYITNLAGVGAGTSIQVPSGSKLVGLIKGSVYAPGTVLQISTGSRSAYLNTTSSSYTDTGLSANITPLFSNSLIVISVSVPAVVYGSAAVGYGNQTNGGFQIVRQVPGTDTNIHTDHSDGGGKYAFGLVAQSYTASSSTTLHMWNRWNCIITDSPSSVGIVTYKLQCAKGTSGMGSMDLFQGTPGGFITLTEIAQ